jgi:UDP-N-acetylmuramoyl-tripeptide--D-alanyl-D-alanine ligase
VLSNPFITQLTILQQEGYDPLRFLNWWYHNPFKFKISHKKPLVYTQKARYLILISLTLFLTISLSMMSQTVYLLLFVVLSYIFPAPYLVLAVILIFPYERTNLFLTINRIRGIIKSHPNLTVIGITGSYGKTSVKDFLYEIFRSKYQTLKTPESYNTIFGIQKVVDFELLTKTQVFLCEMGAYQRGDIAKLCLMCPPQYSILTAVGNQHLERFKSLSNTTVAKFEIVDAVKPQQALVNLDNPHIKQRLKLPQYKHVQTYSLQNPKADFYVSLYKLRPTGTDFSIKYKNQTHHFISPLFGTSNLYNLTASISMALLHHISPQEIAQSLHKIKPAPHRLELKKIGPATLIDNAFSSNQEGFTTIISDLSKLPGKKLLITPGLVELGDKTAEVHQTLGHLASPVFDKIYLVGDSIRTKNFEIGLTQHTQSNIDIKHIPNQTNLWPIIHQESKHFDWILLENDLPDNF